MTKWLIQSACHLVARLSFGWSSSATTHTQSHFCAKGEVGAGMCISKACECLFSGTPHILCMACVLLGIWHGGSGRARDPTQQSNHTAAYTPHTLCMACVCVRVFGLGQVAHTTRRRLGGQPNPAIQPHRSTHTTYIMYGTCVAVCFAWRVGSHSRPDPHRQ